MLKSEFEAMVGKQVSYDTYEQYNAMYMALPETVSKQEFVAMLNIKAIPEDDVAIQSRLAREKLVNDIKEEIAHLQWDVKQDLETIATYKEFIASSNESADIDYWKREIKWKQVYVRRKKAEIQALKSIL